MNSFDHKSVLITGGSSGIGLALARLLAAQNANVCILARDNNKLASSIEDIKSHQLSTSQKFVTLQADVSHRDETHTIISKWMSDSGPPDLVINSAGVTHPGEFSNLAPDLFDWMMDINFHGTVNVTRTVLPLMVERKSGHIVNISSLVGYLGMYAYTAYAASKFAVRGFTDSLRAEVTKQGVDLSIVFPPDTDTPQLFEENKHKPPLLFAMEESAPVMSADTVAKIILRGVKKRQYIITPGFSSWFYFRLMGLLGLMVYPVVDFMLDDARRKIKHNQSRYTNHHKVNPD